MNVSRLRRECGGECALATPIGPCWAAANLKKHKVRFADAALSLEDPRALVATDPDASGEGRFICLGADPEGRVLVTVFTHRGKNIRIISSRRASTAERRSYNEP